MEKVVFKKNWQPYFARCGLHSFDDFFSYPNSTGWHSKRLAVPLTLGKADHRREFFLKRFYYAHLRDALSALVYFRRPFSQAQCEWENAHLLRRKGFDTFNPVCFGARTILGLERQSFVVTQPVPGRPMTEFASQEWLQMPAEQRQSFIIALAHDIRRMHDAGIRMPDLYAWHIFIRQNEEGRWRFAYIDLHRMQPKNYSRGKRIRDLGRLVHSLRPEYFNPEVVQLLLQAYAGDDWPGGSQKLTARVRQRARALAARRKTKPY